MEEKIKPLNMPYYLQRVSFQAGVGGKGECGPCNTGPGGGDG